MAEEVWQVLLVLSDKGERYLLGSQGTAEHAKRALEDFENGDDESVQTTQPYETRRADIVEAKVVLPPDPNDLTAPPE